MLFNRWEWPWLKPFSIPTCWRLALEMSSTTQQQGEKGEEGERGEGERERKSHQRMNVFACYIPTSCMQGNGCSWPTESHHHQSQQRSGMSMFSVVRVYRCLCNIFVSSNLLLRITGDIVMLSYYGLTLGHWSWSTQHSPHPKQRSASRSFSTKWPLHRQEWLQRGMYVYYLLPRTYMQTWSLWAMVRFL